MKHILLTGFPGLLSEELLRSSREVHSDLFWHLVVLPEEVAGATARLRELDFSVSEYAVYPGDITKANLGLPEEDARRIQAEVETCFHLAAQTDISASARDAHAVNVWGTCQVIEFVKACPNVRRFNYVSTCYVSGTLEGELAEDELPEPASFRNEHERSKYEAERIVRDQMDKIPTTIFRPAMIVGDSQRGVTTKYDGPYIIIRFFRWGQRLFYWMPNLGSDDTWLNTVPVDFAGAVLRDVGLSDEFVGKTLHVADPHPPTTAQAWCAFYHQISGRTCFGISPGLRKLKLWAMHHFPLDLLTGMPARSLDYLEHRGRYQTSNLEEACTRFGLRTPQWEQFYPPVIKFALLHRKYAANAALIREFRLWCMTFRVLYALTALGFLFFPGAVARFLTMFDGAGGAATMVTDNLLYRPLGISLVLGLFVAVASLERNPFQKPLHILIIGGKFLSAGLYFFFAAYCAAFCLFLGGLVDGFIGVTHLLFYYRLRRVRPMAGGEIDWNPFGLLFPQRFVLDFTETMTPALAEPINIPGVVSNIREHVRQLPFVIRYGFVLSCYYILLILPCFSGYPPYFLMSEAQRDRYLRHAQNMPNAWLRLPLIFVKMVCSLYLYQEAPYLRSIGAI